MSIRLIFAGVLIVGFCPTHVGAAVQQSVFSDNHCGGSLAGWVAKKPYELMGNVVSIAPGQVKWNGHPLTTKALKGLLSQAAHLSPRAPLHVVINGNVDCADVLAIRKNVDAILRCGADQLCHEYSEAEWKRTFPQPLHR